MRAAPGPQALTWVTTLTANPATASLIWTNISKYEFTNYQLVFNALQPTTSGAVRVEGSVDRGVTYGLLWNGSYMSGTAATSWTTEAASATHIIFPSVMGSDAYPYTVAGGLSGNLFLTFSPLNALTTQINQIIDPPQIGGLLYAQDSAASRTYPRANAAYYKVATVGEELNTLRFTSAAGTFDRGSITIYGINV